MRPYLVEFLACPECKSRTLVSHAAESLPNGDVMRGEIECRACQRRYPIASGVAVMMPDDLRTVASADPTSAVKRQEIELRDAESRIYDDLFPDDKFKAEIDTYLELFQPTPGMRVLDLGCGTGRITKHYLASGATIVGLDFSLASLAVLAERAGADAGERLQLVQGDVCRLPFATGAFDAVMSIGLLCNLPGHEMRERALAETARVLAAGGTYVMSTYNFGLIKRLRGLVGLARTGKKEGIRSDGLAYYNHGAAELRAQLEPHFIVEVQRGTDNRLPVVQHLSPRLSAALDRWLSRTRLALPVTAREMVVRGRRRA